MITAVLTSGYQLDFENAEQSIAPFVASLLSAVGKERQRIKLTGSAKLSDGTAQGQATVSFIVNSLGTEDASGVHWMFSGFHEQGWYIKGYIDISKGHGYIEVGL